MLLKNLNVSPRFGASLSEQGTKDVEKERTAISDVTRPITTPTAIRQLRLMMILGVDTSANVPSV